MAEYDYVYRFSDIGDKLSEVEATDMRRNIQRHFNITINDSQLDLRYYPQMPTKIADLIDLAVTVSVADRLSYGKKDLPRRIHIIAPVRHPEGLSDPLIVEHLRSILYWYTRDHWSFEFTPRLKIGRQAERQLSLAMPQDHQVEVSLWSGGLDSLAGLYNRLSDDPETHHIVFGCGSNPIMYNTQQKLADAVSMRFPGRVISIRMLVQLENTRSIQKNSHQRSRGFFFTLLGAVCAFMQGQEVLYIYENGIGAINLPFRDSEVGLDHSRAVHPRSLAEMGDFVSHFLGKPFLIQNLFLFQTKAQMCERLAQDKAVNLINRTKSCDRQLREQPTQCGYCSSCLLRRQALTVVGMENHTRYNIISAHERGHSLQKSKGEHLRAMLDQVATMEKLLNSADPWFSFSKRYIDLLDIVDRLTEQNRIVSENIQERLLQLYRRYVQEWDSDVRDSLSRGLLK